MAKKRSRRLWSDEEKIRICRQTRVPGVSVSQVARRYDVNANMVFAWLRDDRYRVTEEAEEIEEQRFLPVEIVEHIRPYPAALVAAADRAAGTNVLEIDLACGHQLRISGAYDPVALSQLIRSLSA